MCPACIGSAFLLFTGATSSGGLTAFIARKALRWRRSRALRRISSRSTGSFENSPAAWKRRTSRVKTVLRATVAVALTAIPSFRIGVLSQGREIAHLLVYSASGGSAGVPGSWDNAIAPPA